MNKTTKLTAALSVCGALFALTTAAGADEIWMMPGQLCQPADSTHAARITYENTNGVRNSNTTSTANVKCPAAMNGNATSGITSATLYVHDRHTSQNVSCTMYMYEENGNLVYSQTVTSSGATADVLTPSFTGFPTSDVYDINFSCTLPPRLAGIGDGYSRVIGYVITSAL